MRIIKNKSSVENLSFDINISDQYSLEHNLSTISSAFCQVAQQSLIQPQTTDDDVL